MSDPFRGGKEDKSLGRNLSKGPGRKTMADIARRQMYSGDRVSRAEA